MASWNIGTSRILKKFKSCFMSSGYARCLLEGDRIQGANLNSNFFPQTMNKILTSRVSNSE